MGSGGITLRSARGEKIMFSKYKSAAIVLPAFLALSACGGGGGGTSVVAFAGPHYAAQPLTGPASVDNVATAFNTLNNTTSASNMAPAAGATFSRADAAVIRVTGGSPRTLIADSQLAVLPNGVDVIGFFDAFQDATSAAAVSGNLDFQGSVTGNQFSGALVPGSITSNIDGDNLDAGTVRGTFVGTNATDVLGEFGGSLDSGDAFTGFYVGSR